MIAKTSKFLTSIASTDRLEQLTLPQFAFVGRSNVGKSSLLNALCNRKNLAKTSSTPGRTRLINIFEINGNFLFVDLPGYGFAKASKKEQGSWQNLIGTYLQGSKNLRLVFVLLDSRHEPTEKDIEMLEYLYAFGISFKIILTKSDKLSKTEIQKNKMMIASKVGVGIDDLIITSSEKRQNLEKVWEEIEKKLN